MTFVGIALAAGIAFGVTAVTGLPVPGSLRRYSLAELDQLADRVNAQPDRASGCNPQPTHAIVHVDVLKNRVVVDRGGPTLALTAEEQRMLSGGPLFVSETCDYP